MHVAKDAPTFNDRVMRLLERVEYRRVESDEDKTSVFRMRHDAYVGAGSIEPNPEGVFTDPYDDLPNVWMIGVHVHGELMASLRVHVALGPHRQVPTKSPFPEVIDPLLSAGKMIVEGSRLVSKVETARRFPQMPYVTLRPMYMAECHFGADYIAGGCRVEHQAFYRRMCSGEAWVDEPRPYPGLNKPVTLVGYDCRAKRGKHYSRYPFCLSSEEERRRMFERTSHGESDVWKAIGRVDLEAA